MLVAHAPVFFERLCYQLFQPRRNIWIQSHRRHRRFFKDGVEDDGGGVSAEGKRARCHFIQHRSEAEEVAACIELFAASLLGRHVGHCSQSHAGTREIFLVYRRFGATSHERAWPAGTAKRLLCQPEIKNLGVAALGDEYVRRFDVAVDDAFFVRCVERVSHFYAQLQQQIHRQRLAPDTMLERLPFEMLHHNEVPAVLLPDLVNRADVRMIQRGSGARLPLKSLQRIGIARQFLGQKLQGDVAAEARVLSLVDDSHSAATEFLDDFVVGNDLAGQNLCVRHVAG